ncbi:hypothetical protein Mgra_00006348 [Meloidogyne graminicola]|uniref:Uncharacterized protein n=1 Tax=Meloidogyne graminicola TaxID=189291 RepID=A0A8S9ZLN2_9BILA|nr:hypothetical protein Mgra_00006348 [Meloidogyne graminicola]
MLVATIILFRCYMLYCQDHLNIRHYQRPPEQQQNKEDEESRFYANSNLSLLYYKIKEENNKELFNPIKLENKSRNENNNIKCCNYNNNNQKNIASNRYSFKSIFDDD